jgi:dihydrofolate synthase / folylpolyglutamate synthase
VTAYADVLARLFAARRFGVVLGLERMRGLLERLGDPDRRLGVVVHVAGTNGKGSTVAMIAALVAASGARVATYTSPHLTSLTERITVGGAPIEEADLVAAAERVWAAGGEELTFFEQVTAIAVVCLAAAAPDVTVLEVGLGGRLDATNAVGAPAVAVVTGVAMDHQEVLGDTLEAIAGEKAGIFKAGQRAVIGASGEAAAVPVLVAGARAAGVAALVIAIVDGSDRDQGVVPAHVHGHDQGVDHVDDHVHARIVVPAQLGLAGPHQAANAAAALAALDALEALGAVRPLDAAARAAALASARHPGRFEAVSEAPRIVLDGAHNPHGARALAAAIEAAALPHPRVLVLAVSADKDVAAIAGALVAHVDAVIATAYGQPRALAPDALAATVRGLGADVQAASDIDAALAASRARAGQGGSVIVAGSLFVVGEARARLVPGVRVDPMFVTDPTASKGP